MLEKNSFAGIDRKLSPLDFLPVVGPIKQVVNGVQDIRHGAPRFGLANIAAGLCFLALDGASIASLAFGLAPLAVAGQTAVKAGGRTALLGLGKQVTKLALRLTGPLASAAGHQALRIFGRFKYFHRAKKAVQKSVIGNAKSE